MKLYLYHTIKQFHLFLRLGYTICSLIIHEIMLLLLRVATLTLRPCIFCRGGVYAKPLVVQISFTRLDHLPINIHEIMLACRQ